MGISGLNNFIQNKIPEINNTIDLSTLKNKRIVIDTRIFLYKYKYNNRNFLEGFIKQLYRLRLNNIIPIYVFDGKPPKEKNEDLINFFMSLQEDDDVQNVYSNVEFNN